MARERKIKIGAINITMHPHDGGNSYVRLFREAFNLHGSVRIRGDRFGTLAAQMSHVSGSGSVRLLRGDILCFTHIDVDGNWFNMETREPASEDDLESIQLPDHLKPNSDRFSYVFYPEHHILIYESLYSGKTLGPSNAERFFDRIFNQSALQDRFGVIEVTHIVEAEELRQALSMPRLETLTLKVKRPNPDSQARTAREVLSRMESLNVGVVESTYKAVRNSSIVIDEELRAEAEIAANNGMVSATGKDRAGHPFEFTTKDHPVQEPIYYDPELQADYGAFESGAESLLRKILSWLRR